MLANWWAGRVISNQINGQLTEILGDELAGGLKYEELSVSPLLSQITFSNFSFRSSENVEFKSETIRASFTYRDYIHLLTEDSTDAFNEISFISLYINDSSWIDYQDENEITLVDGFFTLNGNINEILRAVVQKRSPSVPFNLDVDIYELQDQDLNVSQSFLPGFRQPGANDYIEKFEGSFNYDPVLKELHAKDALLRANFADLEFDGTASYDGVEGSIIPSNFRINYNLNAQPTGAKFTITPDLGQIAFNNVDVQATANVDTKDVQESPLNLFLTEGETIFNLDQIRLHPSEKVLQEYGVLAQAFGLDLQSLSLNNVSGRYTLGEDSLAVQNTILETRFFTATLNADVSLRDNWIQSEINEGSLRVSDMSPEIEGFFNDAGVLFDKEWERDNDDILIYFTGPVSSPEITN